jgi:hypothetical protein
MHSMTGLQQRLADQAGTAAGIKHAPSRQQARHLQEPGYSRGIALHRRALELRRLSVKRRRQVGIVIRHLEMYPSPLTALCFRATLLFPCPQHSSSRTQTRQRERRIAQQHAVER